LQCIQKGAFADNTLAIVVLPATVNEVDPSAFESGVWPLIEFDGPLPLLITDDFLCSADSGILSRSLLRSTSAIVPLSMEPLGDRCFEYCSEMTAMTIENSSELKRIGGRAFYKCGLSSIRIPAPTEDIDGSAFVGCRFREMRVAAGSVHFSIEGNLLLTSNGTVTVTCFGGDSKSLSRRELRH
jgi:hypothetical protein